MTNTVSKTKSEPVVTEASPLFGVVTAKSLGLNSTDTRVFPDAVSISVRSLLGRWRQGTACTKSRSEVARTNRKPWRQKGTGRARAGTARSPLWRGGGTCFGPKPKEGTQRKTPKMMRRAGMESALSDFLDRKRIFWFDQEFDVESKGQAARASDLIAEIALDFKKVNLFVRRDDLLTTRAFRNIPGVRILFFDEPDTYSLSDAGGWIVHKRNLDDFKNMVAKWLCR